MGQGPWKCSCHTKSWCWIKENLVLKNLKSTPSNLFFFLTCPTFTNVEASSDCVGSKSVRGTHLIRHNSLILTGSQVHLNRYSKSISVSVKVPLLCIDYVPLSTSSFHTVFFDSSNNLPDSDSSYKLSFHLSNGNIIVYFFLTKKGLKKFSDPQGAAWKSSLPVVTRRVEELHLMPAFCCMDHLPGSHIETGASREQNTEENCVFGIFKMFLRDFSNDGGHV